MLQRNYSVAPGYWQSRWADSHGGFLQNNSSRRAGPTMLCWTSASPCQWWHPGGWLACHPARGDSTFTQVQPPHQEPDVSLLLSWDRAPLLPAALPIWTSCFEYRFLVLTQPQEPQPQEGHKQHDCTLPPSQPFSCPAGTWAELKDPMCISNWAASLPLACSREKASDIICKDSLEASSSPAFQGRLGPKQDCFLSASV